MAGKEGVSIDVRIIEGKDGLKKLTFDADGLRKIMEENIKVAKKFESNFTNFSVLSVGVNAISNALGQLSSTLQTITGESLTFSKAMREANTMAGKDSEGFKKLKGEVAELAKEIPIARDQLANGLYQTISNGVPENNWIDFLNTSARSAVGGLADINQVVGVTSTLIKNYGLEWSAAADIQDKIQLTAKNGVTSFEQLAQALPRVAGNAATLGVSIDELMGTFATLTGVSGNTAEVSTQLAAIFTALVKPSSEAADMAAKMGIEFNAAAIKAAGGLENFLSQLDRSVKAYAQANGVLEQEVYSKLFGSAESLRALIPLQGELADKFSANVANMVNSAGTMEAAYKDMSSTGEAAAQILKNKWAAVTDVIAGAVSSVQPYINFFAELSVAAASVTILANAMQKLNIQQALLAVRAKAASAGMVVLGLNGKSTAAVLRVLSGALKTGAYSATAMKIALRGLLLASGVGAAIAVVSAAIDYFTSSADDAVSSAEKLDDATDEYTQAAAAAKVQIDKDIKALDELIKSKKDTSEAVKHLNDSYGAIFGTFKTADEWYKVLTRDSQLYVKQIGYEAQARALASKIAENAINREMAAQKKGEWENNNHDKMRRSYKDPVTGLSHMVSDDDEWKSLNKNISDLDAQGAELQKRLDIINTKTKEINTQISKGVSASSVQVKVNEMTWQQCADAIDANDRALKNTTDPKRIAELKAQNAQLLKRKKLMEDRGGFGSSRTSKKAKGDKKKKLVADPKTEEDFRNNIGILSKKFTGEDTPEQRKLLKDIALYEKKLKAIELTKMAASRPTELNTLEDINKELRYQNALREAATDNNRSAIDVEIKRLEALKDQKEHASHTELPVDEIKTYAQLNDELSYYQWLVENGSEEERIYAQERINALDKVKRKWDEALADLKKPGDISTLDNIEKLDDAISYIDGKIKTANDKERAELQRTKMAYVDKRAAQMRSVEIPQALHEADQINKLTGKAYKVKIQGMGFDELTEKINDLQAMLNDTENPVTDEQRKDIESLISTYEKWRKEGIDAFATFQGGWDGVKGIGGGIESLTSALSGNANAWQTVTGIVDSFIQIYQGVQTIVGIINMLTKATQDHETAEKSDALAVQSKTAATVMSTAATTTDAAVSEVNTGAKSGEAIANATAEGAKMPFPLNLVAIAAGVAAVVGALASIGSFATGGIVGGSSYSGDKLFARVNSGEMILNSTQQRNLFRMINTPRVNSGQLQPIQISPDLRALNAIAGAATREPVIVRGTLRGSGRNIVATIANETRIGSKSGRRTNIKL